MKGESECGGLSQGEIGLSHGEIGLPQRDNGLPQAKPACPAPVPPRSAVPAALLPQPSIWTRINLQPQRIGGAAGCGSTAQYRLPPELAAATATATKCGAPVAASAARIRRSARPENRSPGRRCRPPRSARAPGAVNRAPTALRNRRLTDSATPCRPATPTN